MKEPFVFNAAASHWGGPPKKEAVISLIQPKTTF